MVADGLPYRGVNVILFAVLDGFVKNSSLCVMPHPKCLRYRHYRSPCPCKRHKMYLNCFLKSNIETQRLWSCNFRWKWYIYQPIGIREHYSHCSIDTNGHRRHWKVFWVVWFILLCFPDCIYFYMFSRLSTRTCLLTTDKLTIMFYVMLKTLSTNDNFSR